MSRANMDKNPQEVAAMFDGVARRYDIVNDILSLGRTKAWRKAATKDDRASPRDEDPGYGRWDWVQFGPTWLPLGQM
jgi:demethylmenaquinone methyltransferase / 2-methoxy-6-polyprenyl-1,4-benzoquinol methylase